MVSINYFPIVLLLLAHVSISNVQARHIRPVVKRQSIPSKSDQEAAQLTALFNAQQAARGQQPATQRQPGGAGSQLSPAQQEQFRQAQLRQYQQQQAINAARAQAQAGAQQTIAANQAQLQPISEADRGLVQNAKDIYDYRNTNPFGKFGGGAGVARNRGFNVLGTGYRDFNSVQAGWPNGVQTKKGVEAYALGRRVANFPRNFNLSPAGSIAEYNIGRQTGGTVLDSGFLRDRGGHAGISGYSWGDRKRVPVLGTDVVDVNDGSGLDITGFNFAKARDAQYGPVRLQTQGTSFSSPWIGQLISRGIWDKTLKKAGYSGIPGGVRPKGGIPGVPLVG